MRTARALVSALVGVPMFAAMLACGGEGSFPEAEPCTTPTSTPNPRRNLSADALYTRISGDGLQRLDNLTRAIRTKWPNDAPSNRLEFRQDFANYVRDVSCLAADLKALKPSGDLLIAYDTEFDGVMDETVALAEFGRDAVKARNSSKYREWIRAVDAMSLRHGELQATVPR